MGLLKAELLLSRHRAAFPAVEGHAQGSPLSSTSEYRNVSKNLFVIDSSCFFIFGVVALQSLRVTRTRPPRLGRGEVHAGVPWSLCRVGLSF